MDDIIPKSAALLMAIGMFWKIGWSLVLARATGSSAPGCSYFVLILEKILER